MKYPDCELIPIDYGDKFPWERISEDSDDIFMVDFSLQPFDKMAKLFWMIGSRFIWIDHHKSAIEEHRGWNHNHCDTVMIFGERKIGIGACRLVWDYLYPDISVPTFIKLLSEYDVWNHSDPRTLPFQYGMRQYDTNPNNKDFWNELFDVERVQQIVDEGSVILNYEKQSNEKYIKVCYFETELDGLKCVACNKMLSNSKLFDSVWNPEKYDAMLTFGWRKGSWTVSLYTTKEDIDVSVIAKNRGGGGHKSASGWQAKELPFKLN